MYHVIGTGITISILYLISLSFYSLGFYSQAVHRKLWNSVLAITFLFTAIAGIFMALQINYKWNIPFIKSILKWHVEIGVSLGLTGIFHFLWHLKYYGTLFKATDYHSVDQPFTKPTFYSVLSNLFIVGFTSTSVQFLMMREIMNISGGYELIAGVFLGSWLIASAAGAAIAGKSGLNDIRKINLAFSVSPLISLALMILLSRLLLETGETPSFLLSMIFTFLLLIPFCLVSGFTFVKLISAARNENSINPGRSFSIETTGGIAAGILLSLLTAGILNTYQLLLTIIFLTLAYTTLTFYIFRRNLKLLVKTLFVIIISVVLLSHPDIYFRKLLLPGIKVKETEDTPYGNITKGILSGEESIYYNQRLLAYNDDAIEREEDIHYALLQRAHPEKVLMISGSLASHLPEILKYQVKKIIYIERDPALTKTALSEPYNGPADLIIENTDAFRYLRNTREKLDAIILLLPPPSTFSLNRYYTSEFFSDVKKSLVPGGVFMCSPGSGDNYLNKESRNLCSSIFNSLSGVFRYVIPIVGNKLYLIASDEELSDSICHLTEERKINNIYVSSDYLADDLIERRSNEVMSAMDHEVQQNRSAYPVACFHFQSFNFSKDLSEKTPAIVLLVLVFAFPVLAVRRRNLLMYASASALAGFEIIILLTLQLTVGNMYQFTGMILAFLMGGLALGSGIELKFLTSVSINIKALFLIIYYCCIALCFNYIMVFKAATPALIIILLSTLVPSCLTGNIFRELTMPGKTITSPGSTYSADLAGSALGFIIISGIVLPAFGIKASIFFLSILIFAGILFGTTRNK
jgi:spermidine synthase